MKVFGLEKLSLVDFDGVVAATVFTGNCNFRCPFCHNASLVSDYKELPTFSEEDIFAYLSKRKGILEGVCITGGEPTLNAELPEFCAKIKGLGYKVKIDTNGTNPQMIKRIIDENLADYFAMDIKNDKEGYGRTIGIENYDLSKVEKSVEIFLSGNTPFEFRTTLIDEFHDEKNMENIGQWIKGTEKYFLQKFKDGENCISRGLHPVSDEKAKKFLKVLEDYIPNVKLRGYDI